MRIQGTVVRVYEPVSGVSQRTGNAWVSQDFILEYKEDPAQNTYDRMVLTLRGYDEVQTMALKVGDQMEVVVGSYVTEWNGKAYNHINMRERRKMEPQPAVQEPDTAPMEEHGATVGNTSSEGTATPSEEEKEDDLPF